MGPALTVATLEDAPAIASLRTRVAEQLTHRYGPGHWSPGVTAKAVLFGMRLSPVYVARDGGRVVGTLRIASRKPWAIDPSYFTVVRRAVYLLDMAVDPELQRRGIGRLCLEAVRHIAHDWPSEAIRLDAYDSAAGAGEFYAKCGYREVGRVTYKTTPLVYYELML
jgi:GNAT superfamily N-acetyltransferase